MVNTHFQASGVPGPSGGAGEPPGKILLGVTPSDFLHLVHGPYFKTHTESWPASILG